LFEEKLGQKGERVVLAGAYRVPLELGLLQLPIDSNASEVGGDRRQTVVDVVVARLQLDVVAGVGSRCVSACAAAGIGRRVRGVSGWGWLRQVALQLFDGRGFRRARWPPAFFEQHVNTWQ